MTIPNSPAASPLTKLTVGAALLASTALSGFGVGSAFWDGLAAGRAEAWIGLAVIGTALAASEVGAVTLAYALTRDGLARDAVTWSRGVLFALCTLGNVLAGHYGAEAINTRLVAPQRAPYEAGVSSSAALLELANNTKADAEARHAREAADLERAFEAERQANPTFVTSRGRQQQESRAALASRQAAELRAAQTDIAAASEQLATARANLEEAPKGFGPEQMWGFAILLELLKGAMVALAAPRRRRADAASNVLPIEAEYYAELERTGDEEALVAIESRAGAAKALAQHALRRLRKRAA